MCARLIEIFATFRINIKFESFEYFVTIVGCGKEERRNTSKCRSLKTDESGCGNCEFPFFI